MLTVGPMRTGRHSLRLRANAYEVHGLGADARYVLMGHSFTWPFHRVAVMETCSSQPVGTKSAPIIFRLSPSRCSRDSPSESMRFASPSNPSQQHFLHSIVSKMLHVILFSPSCGTPRVCLPFVRLGLGTVH